MGTLGRLGQALNGKARRAAGLGHEISRFPAGSFSGLEQEDISVTKVMNLICFALE